MPDEEYVRQSVEGILGDDFEVTPRGSRRTGTAGIYSDYDYVVSESGRHFRWYPEKAQEFLGQLTNLHSRILERAMQKAHDREMNYVRTGRMAITISPVLPDFHRSIDVDLVPALGTESTFFFLIRNTAPLFGSGKAFEAQMSGIDLRDLDGMESETLGLSLEDFKATVSHAAALAENMPECCERTYQRGKLIEHRRPGRSPKHRSWDDDTKIIHRASQGEKVKTRDPLITKYALRSLWCIIPDNFSAKPASNPRHINTLCARAYDWMASELEKGRNYAGLDTSPLFPRHCRDCTIYILRKLSGLHASGKATVPLIPAVLKDAYGSS
jgi:hypothetical protein